MPLYEYTCKKCENEFEALVYSEAEVVECPKCDSEKVEKKMSVPARPVKSLPIGSGCGTEGPPCGPSCCRL
jgi:putative FmdB family regulatory protein